MSNTTSRYIPLLMALLVFSIPVLAQEIPAPLCNGVFDAVGSAMKPTKIYRRDLFTTDCDFEFESQGKGKVLLSITRYETEADSRDGFVEESKDAAGDPRKKGRLDSRAAIEFWDEIALFPSARAHNSYLLLRKSQFVIQILSDDRQVLLELEKLLRELPAVTLITKSSES